MEPTTSCMRSELAQIRCVCSTLTRRYSGLHDTKRMCGNPLLSGITSKNSTGMNAVPCPGATRPFDCWMKREPPPEEQGRCVSKAAGGPLFNGRKVLEGAPTSFVYTYMYIRRIRWPSAKVFRSGNSQAVRLPKQFRLTGDEVGIFRRGDEIVLREKPRELVRAFELLCSLRYRADDGPPQERKGSDGPGPLSPRHRHLHLHSPGASTSRPRSVQSPAPRLDGHFRHYLGRTGVWGSKE